MLKSFFKNALNKSKLSSTTDKKAEHATLVKSAPDSTNYYENLQVQPAASAPMDVPATLPPMPTLETPIDYSAEGIALDESFQVAMDGLQLADTATNATTTTTPSTADRAAANQDSGTAVPPTDHADGIVVVGNGAGAVAATHAVDNIGQVEVGDVLVSSESSGEPATAMAAEQEEHLMENVVYLMDEDGMDARSVVSDAMTEEMLAEELQGLSRAITAIEEEAGIAIPSSTTTAPSLIGGDVDHTAATVSSSGTTPQSLGNGNGSYASSSFISGRSPSGALQHKGSGFAIGAGNASPYDLCRLYNDLGLRLMDAKDYEQSLTMLRKAEALVDNDAPWIAYDDAVRAERAATAALAAAINTAVNSSSSTTDEGDSFIGQGSNTNPVARIGITAGHNSFADPNITNANNPYKEHHGSSGIINANAHNSSGTVNSIVEDSEEELYNRRMRLKAITYNNLGCLFKRRALPQHALGYLQKALVVGEASGQIHNASSTHLNICAAYSALKKYREALAHAEKAILLLQQHLWGGQAATFTDGIQHLVKTLTTTPGAERQRLLASASVLAMAYHNAAFEHERLGRYQEAAVSYARAVMVGTKFLGSKSPTTVSLTKAQKAFTARQQKMAAAAVAAAHHHHHGSTHSLRKPPSTISSHSRTAGGNRHDNTAKSRTAAASAAAAAKRNALYNHNRSSMKSSAGNLMALGKGTLPLDKAAPAPKGVGEKIPRPVLPLVGAGSSSTSSVVLAKK